MLDRFFFLSFLSGQGHTVESSSGLFKERIIRVDDDDDDFDDEDEDEEDASRDSFQSRRLGADVPEGSQLITARDRSPLRGSSAENLGEARPKTREELSGSKSPLPESRRNGDSRNSSASSPSKKQPLSGHPSAGAAAPPPAHSPTRCGSPPVTTRPKIWSISDFINTTSSSTSSASTTTTSSSSSSNVSPASLPSPTALNRQPFLPSSIPSSSPQRSLPGQGFLFLTPGTAAHWPAASRFAGLGGHYPLTLTHTTLSYPYSLTTPTAARAGLEAHAQAVQMAARAAAEGGANRDGGTSGEKMPLHPHFPRLPVSALFSPARDVDGVRSQGES